MSELEGSVAVKQELEGEMLPKGNDGVSPVIDVEKIEGGHKVTVKDVHGVKSFDVMDGEDFDSPILVATRDTDRAKVYAHVQNGGGAMFWYGGQLWTVKEAHEGWYTASRYVTEADRLLERTITVGENVYYSDVVISAEVFGARSSSWIPKPAEIGAVCKEDCNLVVVREIDGKVNFSAEQICEMKNNGTAVVLYKDMKIYQLFGSGVHSAVFHHLRMNDGKVCRDQITIIDSSMSSNTTTECDFATNEDVSEKITGALSEKEWNLIEDVTLSEAVSVYTAPMPKGKYKEVFIEATLTVETEETTAKSVRYHLGRNGTIVCALDKSVTNGKTLYLRAHGWLSPLGGQVYDMSLSDYKYIMGTLQRNAGDMGSTGFTSFDDVRIWCGGTTHFFGAGSRIKVWGR